MGSIQKRDRTHWKARYRGPDRRERSKMFSNERDAKDWLALQTVDLRRGDWVDPKLAQVTVGDWGRVWLERKAVRVKPSTIEGYRSLLQASVLPTWEHVRLADVTFHDVDYWVARLSQRVGPSSVRKAHVVLSQILETAVRDGRLSKNPARGVDLPRLPKNEHRYLSHKQVEVLAKAFTALWAAQVEQWEARNLTGPGRDARPPIDYTPLVLVLAYCGLRFGEAAALRVSNIDLLRGRIRVAQSVTVVAGRLVWGTPKTHAARSVVAPRFLREMLAEQIAGKSLDDLLFTSPEGEPLRHGNFRRRAWDRAVKAAGVPSLTPHDLRHTAASLAIESGANVKAVQNMLGHASAAMTLDVYADLFDDSLDHVADRLDEAFRESRVASTWPAAASNVREMRG